MASSAPARRRRSSVSRRIAASRFAARRRAACCMNWRRSAASRSNSGARLRSDIWVAAYLRSCAVAGVVAVLRRRGAAEAGAIYIKVDLLQGECRLLGPAPPDLEGDDAIRRRFAPVHASATMPVADAEERIR